MPLTKLQKANLLGGIGSDFARAFNPHITPWQDYKLGETEMPSAALELGRQNVPWTTMQNVQTAEGYQEGEEFAPGKIIPPTYKEQPVTTQVPRSWAEAQQLTEKGNLEIQAKRQEIQATTMQEEGRAKAIGFARDMAVQKGGTPTGKMWELMSYLLKDKGANPTSMLDFGMKVQKGEKDAIDGITKYMGVLLNNYGIDINNPQTMQEAQNPDSETYRKIAEATFVLDKDTKTTKDDKTGDEIVYRVVGNKVIQVGTLPTGKPFEQKRREEAVLEEDKAKQEKEKVRHTAEIQRKYRAPGSSIEAYQYYKSQTKTPMSYQDFLAQIWRPNILSLFGSGETGIGEKPKEVRTKDLGKGIWK